MQINLRKFGEIWEDFFDNLLSRQRAEEPRESIESVRERLKKTRQVAITRRITMKNIEMKLEGNILAEWPTFTIAIAANQWAKYGTMLRSGW